MLIALRPDWHLPQQVISCDMEESSGQNQTSLFNESVSNIFLHALQLRHPFVTFAFAFAFSSCEKFLSGRNISRTNTQQKMATCCAKRAESELFDVVLCICSAQCTSPAWEAECESAPKGLWNSETPYPRRGVRSTALVPRCPML